MKLKEYLIAQRMHPMALATASGLSISTIYRHLRGKPLHMSNALKIEKATKGVVAVEEMVKDY